MHKVTGGGKSQQPHTQLAEHPRWGSGPQPGQCQIVEGILGAARSGRRGGLWLAMTEIDSGLARELECVESRDCSEQQWCPQRLF